MEKSKATLRVIKNSEQKEDNLSLRQKNKLSPFLYDYRILSLIDKTYEENKTTEHISVVSIKQFLKAFKLFISSLKSELYYLGILNPIDKEYVES